MNEKYYGQIYSVYVMCRKPFNKIQYFFIHILRWYTKYMHEESLSFCTNVYGNKD